MRTRGEPCPICKNPVRALDNVRVMTFHDRPEKLHYRCWFENQEVIAGLEELNRELDLAASVERYHQEKEGA